MRFILAVLVSIPFFIWADEFPELLNTESSTKADPPAAGESARSFSLPKGVGIKVWASEPEVQNPIAMAWDEKGRMWVAENYTYGSRKVRFDLSLRDRVIVLMDKDGDGEAESRQVFTDQVQMLTSVEVGHGGVWLMCPPQLLFIPDRDGNLVPDGEPEVMLDGFNVAKSNYHNFANGLRWGPDGWLYGRSGHSCPGRLGVPGESDDLRIPIDGGIWRYHPKRKVVEVLAHGTVNPWGHDWDEHGELFFINTVVGHLWHMIPGAHYRESGSGASQNPLVYKRMHQHADHFHYDSNLAWHKSRNGAANDFGGGHAHVGMGIYQADHFPKYWRNKLMTWNQHGRRLNIEKLQRKGSGYTGRHEPDVFLNSDEWFRGMEVSVGPDGAIYGLDWSDTGECHDHTGVHRTSGRIYKFYHQQNPVADLSALENAAEDPEMLLRHPNAWFARQWLGALSERRLSHHKKTIQVCEKILSDKKEKASIRLRAMWGLHMLGLAKPEDFLNDPNEHIRTWSIRLLTDKSPIDSLFGPMEKSPPLENPKNLEIFLAMAQKDDSGLVRLALASSLQRLPVSSRGRLARVLAGRAEDKGDHNLPMMVWYGIVPMVEHDPSGLLDVARATTWPTLRTWIARSLTEQSKERPEGLDALLELVMEQTELADSLLAGMERAVRGMKKAKKPKRWNAVSAKLGINPMVMKMSVLFGDENVIEEMENAVMAKKGKPVMRNQILKVLVDASSPNLREICEGLLDDPALNLEAAYGLAGFDDPEIGKILAEGLLKFQDRSRESVIEILCGRREWANALLDQVEKGRVPKSVISAYHASQIFSLQNEKLKKRLTSLWGSIQQSPESLSKKKEELRRELKPSFLVKANLKNGSFLYEQICAGCHVLYGKGGKLGPDLTGSGRSNLDYLLENIVTPSSAVSADYQMTILRLKDGQVLSGMIAGQDRNSLTLRMPGSERIVSKSSIESREALSNSIMPMGLLDNLSKYERRDLIGYLMHPVKMIE